jgi:hypothetical protein
MTDGRADLLIDIGKVTLTPRVQLFSLGCWTLKTKKIWCFETSRNTRPATRSNEPEGLNLQQPRCRNIKSSKITHFNFLAVYVQRNASFQAKTFIQGLSDGCGKAISEGGVNCKRPMCFVWAVMALVLGF